ncbi:MAG: geranylgeranyl reductase family protein [Chitinispirillaceae bacterium]
MNQHDAMIPAPFVTDAKLSPGECYDIVIIGGGPAGLNAGLHTTRSGRRISILLVDKVVPWEHPIQCAEAVGRRGFEEAIDVKPAWIRQTINSVCFHSPDNTTITYTDKNGGYIIDRAAMQRDCLQELMNRGVTCALNRRVKHVSTRERSMRFVEFSNGTGVYGRVVIDASGPAACLGKNGHLAWKPLDLEPADFVLVEGNLSADTVHIYISHDYAPGGYAWMFPRGRNSANIGVLIGSGYKGKVNIRRLLDAFIARRFPGISIVNQFAGAIPCGNRSGPTAAPGFIKASDAASTVNPVSRAGISEALLSGGLAGDHALRMLDAPDEPHLRRIAGAYEAAWDKKRGARHKKLARVKNSLAQVPEADYNSAARALAQVPQNELTMSKIFRTALGRFPRLVWALRHLM